MWAQVYVYEEQVLTLTLSLSKGCTEGDWIVMITHFPPLKGN